MQSRTPRLMEAQRGSAWPQSQQRSFPGRAWRRCRRASPRPPRSRPSPAESMLLVDGEAVLSRCLGRETGTNQPWRSLSLVSAHPLTSTLASGLSRYADAMLAWTAWTHTCRCFSDSACSMQLLPTNQIKASLRR